MDENLGKFIDNFAELVQLAQSGQHRVPAGIQLLTTLTDHLAVPAESLSVVVEEIPPHRFVDADILMAGLAAEDADFRLLGVGGGDPRHHQSLSDMLQQSQFFPQFPISQPDYTNLAVGPDEQRQVVALGLWLFSHAGSPVAVLQRDANPRYGRQSASLEVLAGDTSHAAGFLSAFRRRMQNRSVLKGQVISLVMGEYGPSAAGVTFHARPALSASDVILPEGLLQKVSDHAVGIAKHRDSLNHYGQHLKRGILLYGKPGTGKTHTVKYLLSQSEGATAILLSGGSLARISEAATMARALQPSIVVLEDCDLIAEDRSFGHGPQPLLFEVLDAMDGLDNDADVAFILTTNRVDMLERALAQRPGRVDLAVDIPLPAQAERVGLVNLYAREIPFSREAVQDAAARTAGTTASFARELVRRAVVAAALDGVPVGDSHLAKAVEDLMADGEALTRSLLGSGTGGAGDGLGGPFPGAPDFRGPFPGGPDFGGPTASHPGS
ncbi:DNA polymerase III delta prime subunit [Arthrobacter sp. V4I6]|uniref:AAA family ATPase n=1 Tax=unclassified Arthrobacter TaxID=235627 RepID=UPI00278233EE|nr:MULTISPECIES: ATP-binding protein [unclassified Arthrobacter]MDQ0820818.1 DNA polymerase III delta prime subunit [Arthrobacter sp. V1I7]MDQ0855080.1 DNA polymerase III delta prime subunit [Arthrobacter sp. V4I6]